MISYEDGTENEWKSSEFLKKNSKIPREKLEKKPIKKPIKVS